jgi:hypothetical protein
LLKKRKIILLSEGCPLAEIGQSLLAGQGGAGRAKQLSYYYRSEKALDNIWSFCLQFICGKKL